MKQLAWLGWTLFSGVLAFFSTKGYSSLSLNLGVGRFILAIYSISLFVVLLAYGVGFLYWRMAEKKRDHKNRLEQIEKTLERLEERQDSFETYARKLFGDFERDMGRLARRMDKN